MNPVIEKLYKLGLPITISNFSRMAYWGIQSFRKLPYEEQQEIRNEVRRERTKARTGMKNTKVKRVSSPIPTE